MADIDRDIHAVETTLAKSMHRYQAGLQLVPYGLVTAEEMQTWREQTRQLQGLRNRLYARKQGLA